MGKASLLIFILCFLVTMGAHAETIILKSGKVVTGVIVEKTDTYIKLQPEGVAIALTYYMDDIESIGSQEPVAAATSKEVADVPKLELLPFKLGECKVGDNIIKFDFPMERGGLYAFNTQPWLGKAGSSQLKLVVALYDKDKNIIEQASSVCSNEKMPSFGSIVFSADKKTIDEVAFFNARVEVCKKKTDNAEDQGQPQSLFAKEVIEAIKTSKESFTALYSSKSDEKIAAMEEFLYQSVKGIVNSGGKLGEIIPIEGKPAEKYKGVCDKPYSMEISAQTADGATTSFSFPIGQVKGEWKILNVDEK